MLFSCSGFIWRAWKHVWFFSLIILTVSLPYSMNLFSALMLISLFNTLPSKLSLSNVKELILHRGGLKIQNVMSFCSDFKHGFSHSLCHDFVHKHFVIPPIVTRNGYGTIEYLPTSFVEDTEDIQRYLTDSVESENILNPHTIVSDYGIQQNLILG